MEKGRALAFSGYLPGIAKRTFVQDDYISPNPQPEGLDYFISLIEVGNGYFKDLDIKDIDWMALLSDRKRRKEREHSKSQEELLDHYMGRGNGRRRIGFR